MAEFKTQRVDEELSQSRARVAISVLSLVIFLLVLQFKGFADEGTFSRGLTTIVSYLTFSVGWFVMVAKRPGQWPHRRYVSMFSDLAIMTVFLHLAGKQGSMYYPIFLWVIIGNGIRFGEKFLLRAILVGAVGFGSVVAFNPYWAAHMEMGLGLMIGVVALPIFFLTVLRRLRNMQDLQVELARTRLAEKAKDQFLATMSHELRTPMNGVLGTAELLQETKLDGEQRAHVDIITRSVESLLHVINDILDYSLITSQRLTLEKVPLDLHAIMTEVHQLLDNAARAKGLRLTLEYPETMRHNFLGDPTRIRQVMFNIVGNAIKFTETGRVRVVCSLDDSSFVPDVIVDVVDTGIGIPPHRQEAIFGQFEQGDNSTTRQYDGTGLGLAISRRLVNMMGGKIKLVSKLGKGSTFTVNFRLPASEEKPLPAVKPLADREDMVLPDFGLSALVVEDNKFNQVVVRNLLKRIGIKAVVAENGAEALQKLDQSTFDVIFMDIRMPVMNGYEATRAIRGRDDAVSRIPILALTGEATRNDVRKCLESGMDVHLSKPVGVGDIVTALYSLDSLALTPA